MVRSEERVVFELAALLRATGFWSTSWFDGGGGGDHPCGCQCLACQCVHGVLVYPLDRVLPSGWRAPWMKFLFFKLPSMCEPMVWA